MEIKDQGEEYTNDLRQKCVFQTDEEQTYPNEAQSHSQRQRRTRGATVEIIRCMHCMTFEVTRRSDQHFATGKVGSNEVVCNGRSRARTCVDQNETITHVGHNYMKNAVKTQLIDD